MPDKIKVAVLTHPGGAHLGAYLTALAACEEVESVVLADPTLQTEEVARKALGTRLTAVSKDAAELLRTEQPTLALITYEAALAPPVVTLALEANCHVLAEKPSCAHLKDFEPLAQLADSKHRWLMLALANRINPPVQQARKLFRAGSIGELYGAELHMVADQTRLKNSGYHQSWFAQKGRAGGGHLMWLGIHWLDLFTYITGTQYKTVQGQIANVGKQPIDVEDSAAMVLQTDAGSLVTMTSGYYLDKGYHSHLKVWGSHGWIELNDHPSPSLTWYSNKETDPQVRKYDGPQEPNGYTPFVQAVVKACCGRTEPPITTTDGLRILRVIYSAYESAATGQRQTLT